MKEKYFVFSAEPLVSEGICRKTSVHKKAGEGFVISTNPSPAFMAMLLFCKSLQIRIQTRPSWTR